jgi:hypothetical protein
VDKSNYCFLRLFAETRMFFAFILAKNISHEETSHKIYNRNVPAKYHWSKSRRLHTSISPHLERNRNQTHPENQIPEDLLDVRISIRELQSKFLRMLPQVCKQPALQPKTRLPPTGKHGTPHQRKTN